MKQKKTNRGKIILVGKRKGAVAAARRCGWEPVIVDVKARMEQSHLAFGGAAAWAVDYVRQFFPDDESTVPLAVAAVAAVTTGSVVAAAAIRSHFGLPGIRPDVAMRCHDKLVMKKAIAAAGIPCAPWMETDEQTTADELIDVLGLPLVLKMRISSGGRGVWICHSREEVMMQLCPGLLAEGFVSGVEMSVETFRASEVTLFRNITHYLKPRWASIIPAALESGDARLVNELAEKVHQALGISSGMSHMEVFLGENGPVFGEIAARPPGGYLMELMTRAYEFDPWELLLRLSAGETPAIKQEAKRYAGGWLSHPGVGEVSGVEGMDEVRAMAHVVEARCKLCPGDVVAEREGSGDSKGYILAEAATLDTCAETLRRAADTVKIYQTPSKKQDE